MMLKLFFVCKTFYKDNKLLEFERLINAFIVFEMTLFTGQKTHFQ